MIKSKIIEYLKAEGRTDVVANKLYDKVSTFPDIFEEFVYWLDHGEFKQDDPITIDGYTAQNLYENTYLAPIGAFNMLTDLRRTDHDEVLQDLKDGMPIIGQIVHL